jgi:hypothetical protein
MKRLATISLAGAALASTVALAHAGSAAEPTAVSLTIAAGGASCTYRETSVPHVTCMQLRGMRIKSGETITLVAKANAPMPAGWQLYIQKQRSPSNNNRPPRQDTYPAPHLCGPTTSAACTAKATRTVTVTRFDIFRAVVQEDDGTSFEADINIRWCDKTTSGCT